MAIVEYKNFKGVISRAVITDEFPAGDHIVMITKYGRAIDIPPTSILGRWEI